MSPSVKSSSKDGTEIFPKACSIKNTALMPPVISEEELSRGLVILEESLHELEKG